jgi:hypothetical protein
MKLTKTQLENTVLCLKQGSSLLVSAAVVSTLLSDKLKNKLLKILDELEEVEQEFNDILLYYNKTINDDEMNPPVASFAVGDVEDPHLVAQMKILEMYPTDSHKYNYTLLVSDFGYQVRVFEKQRM